MAWYNDIGNWAGKQAEAAKDFAIKATFDTAAEVASLAKDPAGYAYTTAVNFKDDIVQVSKDAVDAVANNGKGILKGAALGVGFIPLVGDAAEILLNGAAAGVGIIQNPSNWKGELAEFSMEAAIAAIPGPNAIGILKFAGQAGVAVVKEVAEKGAEVVAKEIAEIASVSAVTAAKNVGEKVVENGVAKTVVEQALMPGVGTMVTKKVADGIARVTGKEIAQAAPKVLDAPVNSLQQAFRDVEFPKLDGITAKYNAFKAANEKLVGAFESAADEIYENVALEPVGQAYGFMTAERMDNDGELVTSRMGPDIRGVTNDVFEAMQHHGITFPEGTEAGDVDVRSVEQYFAELRKDKGPAIIIAIKDHLQKAGRDYESLDQATKDKYFAKVLGDEAAKEIEQMRLTGAQIENEGKIHNKFVVVWDFDKQAPVRAENLAQYQHLLTAAQPSSNSVAVSPTSFEPKNSGLEKI